MQKMENERYVLPLIGYNKPYFVGAEIRVVKNKMHKNFGFAKIYTDMQFNPLLEHELYKDHMSMGTAREILKRLGFVAVPENFDQDDLESLRTIKSKLSKEWITLYNMWANHKN